MVNQRGCGFARNLPQMGLVCIAAQNLRIKPRSFRKCPNEGKLLWRYQTALGFAQRIKGCCSRVVIIVLTVLEFAKLFFVSIQVSADTEFGAGVFERIVFSLLHADLTPSGTRSDALASDAIDRDGRRCRDK